MLHYPNINPTALSIGPIHIQWYGLMYLFGILGGWWLARIRTRAAHCPLTAAQVDDMIFFIALGVILGGRIGYVLIYDLPMFLSQPWIVFKLWQGGLSFHGGLIGVLIGFGLFARKVNLSF